MKNPFSRPQTIYQYYPTYQILCHGIGIWLIYQTYISGSLSLLYPSVAAILFFAGIGLTIRASCRWHFGKNFWWDIPRKMIRMRAVIIITSLLWISYIVGSALIVHPNMILNRIGLLLSVLGTLRIIVPVMLMVYSMIRVCANRNYRESDPREF